MADETMIGTEGTAVEQTAEQVDVKFTQPTPGTHVYTSENVEGFEVSRNDDRKSWTIKFNGEVLKADARSRTEAQRFVNNKVNGIQEPSEGEQGAPAAPKPVTISAREHSVLSVLVGQESAVSLETIMERTELDRAGAMTVVAGLSRKKMITLSGEGQTITEKGTKAYSEYDPAAQKVKVAREKAAVDPEARIKGLEKKYGPRPEGILPPPSDVEWHEARLAVVDARVRVAELDRRMHPFSDIPPKKMKAVQEARQRILEDLEAARTVEREKGPQAAEAPIENAEASSENVEASAS